MSIKTSLVQLTEDSTAWTFIPKNCWTYTSSRSSAFSTVVQLGVVFIFWCEFRSFLFMSSVHYPHSESQDDVSWMNNVPVICVPCCHLIDTPTRYSSGCHFEQTRWRRTRWLGVNRRGQELGTVRRTHVIWWVDSQTVTMHRKYHPTLPPPPPPPHPPCP